MYSNRMQNFVVQNNYQQNLNQRNQTMNNQYNRLNYGIDYDCLTQQQQHSMASMSAASSPQQFYSSNQSLLGPGPSNANLDVSCNIFTNNQINTNYNRVLDGNNLNTSSLMGAPNSANNYNFINKQSNPNHLNNRSRFISNNVKSQTKLTSSSKPPSNLPNNITPNNIATSSKGLNLIHYDLLS